MRKNIPLILFLGFLMLPAYGSAQQQSAPAKQVSAEQIADQYVQLMRQDLRAEKKKLVAANLPLTEDEAARFWPVYDRYTAEHIKIYDQRYMLVKEYAANYDNISAEQAHNFISRSNALDQQISQLRAKWVAEFEKVIPPKKTAMFIQIDRRVFMLIELQLSSQIPLINPE